jgi:hypothetical protein
MLRSESDELAEGSFQVPLVVWVVGGRICAGGTGYRSGYAELAARAGTLFL